MVNQLAVKKDTSTSGSEHHGLTRDDYDMRTKCYGKFG